ncbi:hypothetical protein H2203_002701 [Taxawa tesnikishii (nom. ined.)]|nr:hypothetical protein H2203_002701 [Dothideales sp. JES 119]
MFPAQVRSFVAPLRRLRSVRSVATTAQGQKREGDISDAFASLSGLTFEPLEPRFAQLKDHLIAGHEDAIRESWKRLLASLREEIPTITALGPKVVPEIDFKDIEKPSPEFVDEHKKRGVAVVRNVIPEREVLSMKQDLLEYIKANPQTKAFPAENPQVYELYWSPAQIRARSHPNLLKAQRFLMEFWHSRDPNALISASHPTMYADRLRLRTPGDNRRWEEYDPWESSCRLPVVSDLYQGVGACSMFRMSQGWLSISETGPFEGTLLVNPLLSRATAYYLLRPFFSPKRSAADPTAETFDEAFLADNNWLLNSPQDSWLQGATPGRGQELNNALHPHLQLPKSMTHVPRVRPGDYVAWHCDSIHAVDRIHAGTSDSSVLYIPTCPLTVNNAQYLLRQREAFLEGTPSPDFGGGIGESKHAGRPGVEDVQTASGGDEGMRAFGLAAWDSDEAGLTSGQREVMDRANKILGFYD